MLEGMDTTDALVARVRAALTDDLRRAPWAGSSNPMAGHCYVASEALLHLLRAQGVASTPISLRWEGAPHWALRLADGTVVDATADQFSATPDYALARGKGFLTREPSKRARTVIARVLTGI